MPFSVDQFVDSVGLNVRMSYRDWPTSKNWGNPDPDQNIENLIAELGVRHLRDRIPHPERQKKISYVNPRLASLYQEHGIKFIVGLNSKEDGILDKTQIPAFIDWYANGEITSESGAHILVREIIEGIEGPNEYDRHHNQDARENNWAENLNDYQARVYQAVKANRQLSELPVIAPSLIYTEYCRSPLDSFEASADMGNLHPYPNYPYMRHPTATLDWHLNRVGGCTGDLPVWATETGYLSVKDNPEEISERTAAKYTPRLLTEYFLTGKIRRTYLHEIARGSVNGWGLIAARPGEEKIDGQQQFELRPKPAYYAVKSLLEVLNEATWSAAEREWISPEMNLQPVEISFENRAASTHHLLLQKSNGQYFLLLWQEVESYNPDQGNFEVPADELTAILPANHYPIAVYQYDESFNYVRQSLSDEASTLALNVPDSILILEFSD